MASQYDWKLAAWQKLEAAADNGDAEAQYELANRYFKGEGVQQDYAEAAIWFRKAAELGMAEAQSKLGYLLQHGRGVSKDCAEAAKWYRMAVEQGGTKAALDWARLTTFEGNADAGFLYSLAMTCQIGLGDSPDYAQAIVWHRNAAEQGFYPAAYQIGTLYRDGLGVTMNLAEAELWFRKAAAQGEENAIKALALLRKSNQSKSQNEIAIPDDPPAQAPAAPIINQVRVDTPECESRMFTVSKCVAAGMWGAVITLAGIGSGGLTALVTMPLLGLPWLLYEMHDRSARGRISLDGGEAFMLLLGGAFLSMLCAVPVVIVFVLLKKLGQ